MRMRRKGYMERVRNSEKGMFTPLVFTTTGGMGNECSRLTKKLANLIANKTGESYPDVMRHMRTRLRFALLRSTLVAIRGHRGRVEKDKEEPLGDISFNLIPEVRDF